MFVFQQRLAMHATLWSEHRSNMFQGNDARSISASNMEDISGHNYSTRNKSYNESHSTTFKQYAKERRQKTMEQKRIRVSSNRPSNLAHNSPIGLVSVKYSLTISV